MQSKPDSFEFACSLLSQISDLDDEKQKKLAFLLEQLEHLPKQPRQRRYSPSLLSSAITWQLTSPALYKQLLNDNFLSLPSIQRLKCLSTALTVEKGLAKSTENYLKGRISNLEAREKIVLIMIDEVYCEKRVEFTGGKLYGLENSDATKTLLCFMVKSVAGTYRDMVAMHPISRIDSDVIELNFTKVLQSITEIGMDVVAVSTDGHSPNRKFYSKLCGGTMKTSISHPYNPGSRIHLLFDPVHLLKNFYSNFLNKTNMECPPFERDTKPISASFNHITQLYYAELGMPIKFAHRLNQKVINPRPIERSNVMLADRFFHESTIAALQHYGEEHPEWKSTALFLDIIQKWWSIVNVRTTSIGYKKRNEFKKPIRDAQCKNLQFLEEFSSWLCDWKSDNCRKSSLSLETFTCAIQTAKSMPELVIFLLREKGLKYVLLGKINSDAIERRFGQYRQLAGANYFLSVRQFLEAEKSIRLKSLVKFSHLSMEEISTQMTESQEGSEIASDVDLLLNLLEDSPLEIDMEADGDEAIIYYVAGYVSRKLLVGVSCQSCVQQLCESRDMPKVLFTDESGGNPSSRTAFLEQINRGGLVKPSDLMFVFCLYAHALYKLMFDFEEAKEAYLKAKCPRKVFVSLLMEKLNCCFGTSQLLNTQCSLAHSFKKHFEKAAVTFCNCMLKNYVSEINDKLHEARKRSAKPTASARKIAKL